MNQIALEKTPVSTVRYRGKGKKVCLWADERGEWSRGRRRLVRHSKVREREKERKLTKWPTRFSIDRLDRSGEKVGEYKGKERPTRQRRAATLDRIRASGRNPNYPRQYGVLYPGRAPSATSVRRLGMAVGAQRLTARQIPSVQRCCILKWVDRTCGTYEALVLMARR